tara:strand:+ start:8133 stop:9005 length:873 start_codon:yes stop_codon:yes gene_type:complete
METNALVRENPAELMRQSSDVAGVCREIVKKTAHPIQGKNYVCVEGWQSIATAHGCVAGAEEPKVVDGGVQAMGYVKRMSDGMVLSTGYGFVGDDERTWAKRAEYARRAMAQTRGISRACRSAFSHVVTLMDAGLMTTPAEEMPGDGDGGKSQAATTKTTSKQPPKKEAPKTVDVAEVGKGEPTNNHQTTTPIGDLPVNGEWFVYTLGFGKHKGKSLGDIAEEDPQYLEWLPKRTIKPRDDGTPWESDIELNRMLEEYQTERSTDMAQLVKDVAEGVKTDAPQGDDDVPF